MDEQMLTVLDVAKTLKIGRNSVYVLIYSGELESVKIGSLRRIRVQALREYVDRLRSGDAA